MRDNLKTIYINNVGQEVKPSLYDRRTDICGPRGSLVPKAQIEMAKRRLEAMKKRRLCR